MASISNNKNNGQYVVQFRFQGIVYNRAFPTGDKIQAETFKTEIEKEISAFKSDGKIKYNLQAAINNKIQKNKSKITSVSDEEWEKELSKTNPKLEDLRLKYLEYNKTTFDPSTYESKRVKLETVIRELGIVRLKEITLDKLKEYEIEKLATGKIKKQVIHHYISELKTMVNYFIKQKKIKTSPFASFTFELDMKTDTEAIYFSKEQMNYVLAESLKETNPSMPVIMHLTMLTGMRPNEAKNCKWEWIRRDAKTKMFWVYIPNNSEFKTKTREGRKIPVMKKLENYLLTLANYNATTNKWDKTGYLIRNGHEGKTKTDDRWTCFEVVRVFFKKINLDTLNLYGTDHKVSLYANRHTFCSMLINDGEPIAKVAKYMGHSIQMCSKIYHHLLERDEVDTFGSNFD